MPAMANGRCYLHGGKSTGAKTIEGLARCRRANWKDGRYSAEAKAKREQIRLLLKEAKGLLRKIEHSHC